MYTSIHIYVFIIGKIENELAKIDLSWRENFLIVIKYKKDGQERGFILRAAEELKLGTCNTLYYLYYIPMALYAYTHA